MNRRSLSPRWLLFLVPAIGALVLAAGCGSSSTSGTTAPRTSPRVSASGSAGSSAGGVAAVAYRGIAIAPANLTVHVGQTIRWQNFDATPHNVMSTGGAQRIASKDFGRGGTFEFTPTKTGVIHYICSIHPASMVGAITVVH